MLSPRSLRLRSRPAARLTRRRSTYSDSTAPHQPPPWLRPILGDASPAPVLYAWTPANLRHLPSPSQRQPSPVASAAGLDRRIFVLGVGNLGRLYATSLSKLPGGAPPITLVVHRPELLARWVDGDGLEMVRQGHVERNKRFDVELWSSVPPSRGPVAQVAGGASLRNLIVATKAPAALPELDRARRYLGAGSTVAFAQNGMSKLWPPHGTAYVAHRWPRPGDEPNFLACVTTHGVSSLGAFRSLHASRADVVVGPVLLNRRRCAQVAAESLTDAITAAPDLDGRAVSGPDLWLLQLEKLVVNSVINPLTAVLRCKNGALFAGPSGHLLSGVIDALLREASQVLQALVEHESSDEVLSPPAGIGPAPARHRDDLAARFSQLNLREMLYRVGDRVADNTSSMLQDVQAGRPTEVRDFNGWLVDTANFLGPHIDASCHQRLVDLVESRSVLDVSALVRALLD